MVPRRHRERRRPADVQGPTASSIRSGGATAEGSSSETPTSPRIADELTPEDTDDDPRGHDTAPRREPPVAPCPRAQLRVAGLGRLRGVARAVQSAGRLEGTASGAAELGPAGAVDVEVQEVAMILDKLFRSARPLCPSCATASLRTRNWIRATCVDAEGRRYPDSWTLESCDSCGARLERHLDGRVETLSEDEWTQHVRP